MKKPYFVNCLFENGFECKIGRDGLAYLVPWGDAMEILKDYPKDKHGWFFNDSKDRYCAEQNDTDMNVIINPSIMAKEVGNLLVVED